MIRSYETLIKCGEESLCSGVESVYVPNIHYAQKSLFRVH